MSIKKYKRLSNALEKGMETIIQNGEFDKLFYEYHGNFIKKAQLEDRIIIKLDNPILPVKTPLNNKRLWLNF